LVQVPGAGLDRIDRSALPPGVHLANAYGHEAGIAEYVIGSMIALTRSFARIDAKLRAGEWESQWAIGAPAPPLWPELAGKSLGILGFGHIGEALARRARAFDMKVCAIRQRAQVEIPDGLSFVGGPEQLDDVLRRSDFVAITLSLSPQTRGLLDERRLRVMQPTAYLINVARAEIVDEAALYEALATGRLAGAALDVWYRYPTAPGISSAGNSALSRASQCHHDPACLRLDRGHASGASEAHCGQHRADRARPAAAQRHRAGRLSKLWRMNPAEAVAMFPSVRARFRRRNSGRRAAPN
jgi:phosphoglycerate dehydrogenase-like enzyme